MGGDRRAICAGNPVDLRTVPEFARVEGRREMQNAPAFTGAFASLETG
ncbi:hypothetical protein BAL199_18706 [alpha proteobacterium BAL199]|jgi:hypothetical protein|nr:hypothetical protein BAL199_18706 [alpha proteobacterium BAL199]